ncbi:hypothetical protein [Phytoactinopolyspora mesophila]|uniref:Lipoprotein n=1 Tax=Phytoactinopolyspora mesophila TaxID=2650750 RepID=A0A7K3MDR8_9ACTN|nr:hypothetical protein [Phytoactinopolyspora mesophila]NDL60558.1 hypothetical protein [Phytoactinopolyspora mesophila]
MRLRYRIVGLLAGLVLLGSACSPDATEEDDDGGGQEAAMLAHAQCMRDHGFDWPDPVFVDGEWETHYEGIDLESPEYHAAEAECERVRQEALPDGGTLDDPGERAQIEAELEVMLEFAACMRGEGIDFPDPQLDEDGVISGPAGPSDGDWDSFEAAREFCEAELNEPMP